MQNKSSKITDYRDIIEQLGSDGEPTIRFVYRARNSISSSPCFARKPSPLVGGTEGGLVSKTNGGKLGVFSGSFNPLTLAHLKIIELAEKQRGLNEILLLLAKANVDKEMFGATLDQRLTILERYAKIRDNLSVAVSSHGRFVDKVIALKSQAKQPALLYPPDTQIYFIIGYDTLVRLFDRKYYTCMDKEIDKLFAQSKFIVTNRGENDIRSIERFLSQPMCRKYTEKIYTICLEDRYAQMSSTKVRDRVKSGVRIDELVPEIVLEWIEDTGVYQ